MERRADTRLAPAHPVHAVLSASGYMWTHVFSSLAYVLPLLLPDIRCHVYGVEGLYGTAFMVLQASMLLGRS